MSEIVLSEEQQTAVNMALKGNNLLILGGSGTGKSTVISAIVSEMRKLGRKVAVTATTGIASDLIGGTTINSLLGTFNGCIDEKTDFDHTADLIKGIDTIIVDEISMFTAQMMRFMHYSFKYIKRDVQVIFVGDFHQLSPVQGDYAFATREWNELCLDFFELTQVQRQKTVSMKRNLQLVADGDYDSRWFFLNNSAKEELDAIYLCGSNRQVREMNSRKMISLPEKEICFPAVYSGEVDFDHLPLEKELVFKLGMKVMALKNDSCGHYKNGSIGIVRDIYEERKEVIVDFGKGKLSSITYTDFSYDSNLEGNASISISQLPLRPAYAMTIHKSQGHTFDRANIFTGSCFCVGQLYVALSRVKDVSGIHIMNGIWPNNYMTSARVQTFYKRLRCAA